MSNSRVIRRALLVCFVIYATVRACARSAHTPHARVAPSRFSFFFFVYHTVYQIALQTPGRLRFWREYKYHENSLRDDGSRNKLLPRQKYRARPLCVFGDIFHSEEKRKLASFSTRDRHPILLGESLDGEEATNE